MIGVNGIISIDMTRVVGIIVVHDFMSDINDVITGPFTFTGFTFLFFTVNMTVGWTVFVSPVIFTHNGTFVDFTEFDLSIVVEITFS